MKLSADQKQNFQKFLMHFWYIIVIIVLVGFLLIFYRRNETHKNEIQTLKAQAKVGQTVQKIESKVPEMKEREKQYEALKKENDALKKDITRNDKEVKDLEEQKGEIHNEVQKMDSNALSDAFALMGYPNHLER